MFSFLHTKKDPFTVRREYGIPDKVNFSIRLKDNGWFVVTSPELPGFITQARDAEELLEMVNDAVLTYFDVPESESSAIFDYLSIEGHGTIMSKKLENKLQTA